MTDQRDTTFDPRFDPAFQPGYDPRHDPVAIARTPVRPPVPTRVEPGIVIPPAGSEGSTVEVEGADDRHSRDDDTGGGVRSPADGASPGRNPFEVALWGVVGALLLAGFALLGSIPRVNEGLQDGSAGPADYLWMQVIVIASPMVILLGFATAIALLVIRLVRWAPIGRRSPAGVTRQLWQFGHQ